MSGRTRVVEPAPTPLRGVVSVPGDKSIGHRAVLLNSIAEGTARVTGLPDGLDVRSSMAAMRALGASVEQGADGEVTIRGCAMSLAEPPGPVDCGNSGTTIRLLTGLVAGQDFTTTLTGDASLSRRPMRRITDPLAEMGARIETTNGHPPVTVHGTRLHPAHHRPPVASAQVKSALILAALQTDGETTITEPGASRDHTERMLRAMGVPVSSRGGEIRVSGPAVPRALDFDVCGDPSSAAFFAVAGLLVPGSEIRVRNVCLNPTRTGFVEVLRRMGADLSVEGATEAGGEPVGDLVVRASALEAFLIEAAEVPATIDELPILAVAAAAARGPSVIRGARELRVKESDRIAGTVAMLSALGIEAVELEDGMEIMGGRFRGGCEVETHGDHRLVMCAAVAALAADQPVGIEGAEAVAVSYPGFFTGLKGLRT